MSQESDALAKQWAPRIAKDYLGFTYFSLNGSSDKVVGAFRKSIERRLEHGAQRSTIDSADVALTQTLDVAFGRDIGQTEHAKITKFLDTKVALYREGKKSAEAFTEKCTKDFLRRHHFPNLNGDLEHIVGRFGNCIEQRVFGHAAFIGSSDTMLAAALNDVRVKLPKGRSIPEVTSYQISTFLDEKIGPHLADLKEQRLQSPTGYLMPQDHWRVAPRGNDTHSRN